MTTPNLQTTDAVVQQQLATLEGRIEAMQRAGQTVLSISEMIENNFRAQCSQTYLTKMADWQDQYQRLGKDYSDLVEKLTAGHKMIDSAHDEAVHTAQSFMTLPPAAQDVVNTLNP
ncbi:hypothetical protein [Kitasatospora sp. LaBMicrA B282]|uniref:hypothetical protein n=1 Tax=Kitasatospora sp. LaBMicrA B282 TaxID=3420949 RepID=UPI003D09E1EA